VAVVTPTVAMVGRPDTAIVPAATVMVSSPLEALTVTEPAPPPFSGLMSAYERPRFGSRNARGGLEGSVGPRRKP